MSTKTLVLSELLKNTGQTVSGESMARMFGVSRAAVWKAIAALRREGYHIIGTPNSGYAISNDDEVMTAELIVHHLKQRFPAYGDCFVECFKTIDSTNVHAKRILADCGSLRDPNGALTDAGRRFHCSIITAETQTAGRGRMGRTFYSPEKTGLYMTLMYAPKGGILHPAGMTASTAVAVCRAIKKVYAVQPAIKWVNDLFVNGKKAGGILTEGSFNLETGHIETAIIGIGINIELQPSVLPDEVAHIAGAVLPERTQETAGRCELAAEIAGHAFDAYQEKAESILAEYKAASIVLGKNVEVHPVIGDNTAAYTAKAVDIDAEARLIVELPDGTQRKLLSGEVSLTSSAFTG